VRSRSRKRLTRLDPWPQVGRRGHVPRAPRGACRSDCRVECAPRRCARETARLSGVSARVPRKMLRRATRHALVADLEALRSRGVGDGPQRPSPGARRATISLIASCSASSGTSSPPSQKADQKSRGCYLGGIVPFGAPDHIGCKCLAQKLLEKPEISPPHSAWVERYTSMLENAKFVCTLAPGEEWRLFNGRIIISRRA